MKVNFKSPRYMLPLILLPFLCLFFYAYQQSFGKPKAPVQGRDSLQGAIADVSDQVKRTSLADKLDAYRQQYKKADGYTAINQLQQDTQALSAVPSLYNEREKHTLDSIQKAIKRKYGGANPATGLATRTVITNGRQSSDQALAEALNKMRQVHSAPPTRREPSPADPMSLFRQQMALVDSMEKAHDPQYQAEQRKKLQLAEQAKAESGQKRLPVTKADAAAAMFNTIRPDEQRRPITAMIDQDITGYQGSRLRILLLDDLNAGPYLIRQGTYLYAQITGFTGQRVLLSVTSILQGDQVLPVKLEIYDNDGLPGLYVPASAFRDLSKDLGGGASQGLTLQQSADQNNQMVMSLVQRMFESTTTAVGKLIRQNKAKLKYNSLVYLIDPETLRNHQ